MRTRIKICGITRHEDLACAVNAGADAVGFVFHPSSKRFVSPERAAELVSHLPAFVSSVGLFVNPEPEVVRKVIEIMRPTMLQFHGEESAEFCASFEMPYVKAFRVGGPGMDTAQTLVHSCQQFQLARGWLFDSYTPAYGGSGHAFDHALLSGLAGLEPACRVPVILSGGLNADTLGEPVRLLRPWAVDVSSGVEQAPGIKSAERIAAFVSAVKRADA
jgi:phosphoribosylanthranilate isomerase